MVRQRKDIKPNLKNWVDEFHEWAVDFYGYADVRKIQICFQVRIGSRIGTSHCNYRSLIAEGLQYWKDKYSNPKPYRVRKNPPRRKRHNS